MKKITVEDVIRRSRVSKRTASSVINARTTAKPEIKDMILKVMRKYNFHSKVVARNLKNSRQDKNMGIIIKDLNYPFILPEDIKGIHANVASINNIRSIRAGSRVLLYNLGEAYYKISQIKKNKTSIYFEKADSVSYQLSTGLSYNYFFN